jgi:hypothetical protein
VHDEHAASGSYYCVKVHLAVAGPDIHATDVDGDLYAAIDKISDKLALRLARRDAAQPPPGARGVAARGVIFHERTHPSQLARTRAE